MMMSDVLVGGVLPWPAMLHLEMQGKAEEGADENDQPKDDDAVKSWVDDHGVDDVPRDKEFEPQQNGSTHILAAKTICIYRGDTSHKEESNHREGGSHYHDYHASGLYRGANDFNDLSEC
jgi:hypothetical protein